MVNAVRLSELFYPDLHGREFSLQFSEGNGGPSSSAADVRSLVIRLDSPQWHPPQGKPASTPGASQEGAFRPADRQLPIYLHFDFVDYAAADRHLLCWPSQFRNDTTTEEMSRTRSLINSHPEWTDEQDLQAAKTQGMRFGPEKKNLVLDRIPLKALGEFYGGLKIKNASFRIGGDKCQGCSFADLHWQIELEKVATPGSVLISIEPFRGEIDGVTN
jgi:hypothetical protein